MYFAPKSENSNPVNQNKGRNKAADSPESGTIQAKLEMGTPGDKYEQEADRIANMVVSGDGGAGTPDIQTMREKDKVSRKLYNEEEDVPNDMVQAKLDGQGIDNVGTGFESSLRSAKGGGASLPSNLNEEMSSALGSSMDDVRIHTDGKADQLSRGINARAFTNGNDVFFKSGQYDPGSSEGKRLLAHELTHTVQQKGQVNNVQRKEERKDVLPKHMGIEDVTNSSGKDYSHQYDYVLSVQPNHTAFGQVGFSRIVTDYISYVHVDMQLQKGKEEASLLFVDHSTGGAHFMAPAVVSVRNATIISPHNAPGQGIPFMKHSEYWRKQEGVFLLKRENSSRYDRGFQGNMSHQTNWEYLETARRINVLDENGTLMGDLELAGIPFGEPGKVNPRTLQRASNNLLGFKRWLDEVTEKVQDGISSVNFLSGIQEIPNWDSEGFLWGNVIPALIDGMKLMVEKVPVWGNILSIFYKLVVSGKWEYDKLKSGRQRVVRKNQEISMLLQMETEIQLGLDGLQVQIAELSNLTKLYPDVAEFFAKEENQFPRELEDIAFAQTTGHHIQMAIFVELLRLRGVKVSRTNWDSWRIPTSSIISSGGSYRNFEWWEDTDVSLLTEKVPEYYKGTQHYADTVDQFKRDWSDSYRINGDRAGRWVGFFRYHLDDPIEDAFDWKVLPEAKQVQVYWPMIELVGDENSRELINSVLSHIYRLGRGDNESLRAQFFKQAWLNLERI